MQTLIIAALVASLAQQQETKGQGTGGSPVAQAPAASPMELHRAADAALVGGRYLEAEAAFTAALEADPENATLMYGLACALARAGDSTDALECLADAKELGYRDAAMAHWDSDLYALSFGLEFKALFGEGPRDAAGAVGWPLASRSKFAVVAPVFADWIALTTPGQGLQVLEQASGKTRFDVLPGPTPIVALAASPDGLAVACLHADGRLSLTDTTSGKSKLSKGSAKAARSWRPTSLSFAAGSKRIVNRTNSRIDIWDGDGEYLGDLTSSEETSWWPGGASASSELVPEIIGKAVRLHNVLVADVPPVEFRFEQPVNMAQIAPDGATMAVGTELGTVHLVKLADRSSVMSFVIKDVMTGSGQDPFGDPLRVPVLRFSPNGKHLAACTTSGFRVAMFDVLEGTLLWRTKHLGGRMGSPFPLLCGDQLTIGDRGRYVWDSADGEARRELTPEHGTAFAVLGNNVLHGARGAMRLANAGTDKELWTSPSSARTRRRVDHPSGWIAGAIEWIEATDAHRYDPKRLRAAIEGVKLLPPPKR